VQAHREPFIARTARRARRHKTKVVAAAVLLLTTAIASSAAAGMLWREKQKTNQAWQQAEVEKGKATQNAETAVKVVRELSAYVNQVETGGSQRTTASDRQRRDAIDATLSGYEKLLAIYPDEPAVRMNVARMYRLRANLARFLKETDVAEKSYREARRHYGLLMTAEPGDSFWRSEAALVDYDLALFLMTPGRLAEANDLLNDSIREYDQLRRAEKGISGRPRVLGHMHIVRSELDDQLGRFADSERAARTAVELLSGLADPPQPLDPMFLGMAESRVAIALREQGRTDDAIAAHDAAVGRLAGLMMRQPTNRDVIHQYHQARAERAWTLSRVADRRAAAITDLDAAIAEWEKLEKQYPDAPSYPKNQGLAKLYRGRIKMLLSQMDAGAADLKSAATIFEALAGKYADVPAYRADLGRTFSSLGQLATDPETAAEWYRKARESLDGVAKQSPLNARYVQAMQELDALAGKSR
jgi:tetratricopeptide (TPR) repeat protein